MKKRIWELDVLRGICLILMVYCHIVYDMVYLFALSDTADGAFFDWAMAYTGIFFLLLSGICVTLGSHPIRRGFTVLGGGLLCTLATVFLYFIDFSSIDIVIYFGILHCLGICMLLWPLLRRLPFWALILLGAGVIWLDVALIPWQGQGNMLLLPFSLYPAGFYSSDYFPLIPYLGYFLIGSGVGKLLYRKKESLLPPLSFFPFNFLGFLGRHSLLIYLLHQPILAVFFLLISHFV